MQKKKNNADSAKPKRFFTELAEFGILGDFLKSRMNNHLEKDENFRDDMIGIIYTNSPEPDSVIENFYLENISGSLSLFLEKARIWKQRMH